LPDSLDIIIRQTAGDGPLRGTTNVNLGLAGLSGSVQFTDLQIDSVGTGNELTAETPVLSNAPSANLLLNGDFNSPNSGASPDNWTTWVAPGGGWANHENKVGITYDGSYYMVVGGFEDEGGGCFQTVPATAGAVYELSVLSGADPWWLPYGEMRLFFLNAADNTVGSTARPTLNPPDYGEDLDIPHPWERYSLTATAPAGTTRVKVEFMSTGTGSIWYENARLAELVSGPALAGATTLPFMVQPAPPPVSQTNYVAGITDHGGGSYTLRFIGTPGVTYCVQAATNLVPPITWQAIPGSTHTVTSSEGLWGYALTNPGPQHFFRAAVVVP
jgi:hypothetical protein